MQLVSEGLAAALALLLLCIAAAAAASGGTDAALLAEVQARARPRLSEDRIVFQTKYGDLEFALWPDVAPITCAHILKLAKLGGYNSCSFFRVHKGFVAQTSEVDEWNRKVPLNPQQRAEAAKTVPLEVWPDHKHDRRGLISMARAEDPDSGGSGFSVMLGPAPGNDMQYTLFGEVTRGIETLDRFEELPTKTEDWLVAPLEPIIIESSYVYSTVEPPGSCPKEVVDMRVRFDSQAKELKSIRSGRQQ